MTKDPKNIFKTTRFEISEDELYYREFLKEQWKVKPSRKAVLKLQTRIEEVLKKLGVDVTKDEESVLMQMEFLGIFLGSLSEEQAPKAAGIYVSAIRHGKLAPYAYISCAKVNSSNKEYTFPIIYWEKEIYDEGRPEKL